jgi:acetyl esterase/lipase
MFPRRLNIYMPVLLLMALWVTACSKTGTDNAGTPAVQNPASLPEKNLFNLSYGPDARQTLDIWLPAGRNSETKLMVLIHAGQWSAGDKLQMDFFRNNLSPLLPGYAFAAVNYRLAGGGQNLFPAQEQDINAAVDFLLSRADSFNISKKMVLAGESAGGHLAMLTGYKRGRNHVKAVVALYAPADLTELYHNPATTQLRDILTAVTGATPQTNAVIYQSSSPVNFISANSPATLLVHGDNDGAVPLQQSQRTAQLLQTAGVVFQLKIIPGEGHFFSDPAMRQFFLYVQAFLANNLIFR